jgi:hypothetical protein
METHNEHDKPEYRMGNLDAGNLWKIFMRQLIFLFPIIFTVMCGCGKNPSGPADGAISTQTPDPATNQTKTYDDPHFPPSETNRSPVNVDVITHNSSTNDYWFTFESGPDLPVRILSLGQSVTNADQWWDNWENIEITLGNEQTGEAHILHIPLTEVDDQLATGKYHRLLFEVVDPGDVKVHCE